MIISFKNKELAALWNSGKSRIDSKLHKRIMLRLSRLHAAANPEEMNLPGFNFHGLVGFNPTRYTIHVNGPWCITFEFSGGDASRVDFEQYH
ncbi:type II toxin-antitoxin system RelE/ParE family toxin [Brucella pseudogrignonensis]|uniref:type II toxin-antitoxin system RelE/ParE family toxin n=1 Tax=Brucella pseudogrignonensis TaxID=419475 RepID=UPI0038D14AFC